MQNVAVLNQDHDYDALNHQLDWIKTRVFLASNAAFMAPILSSMEFMWAPVGTAATDGKHFFWDPEDFERCTLNDRVATVPHELHHVARLHILRGIGKDPKVWNIACDIVINRDLRKDGYILETEALWVGDHPEIPFFVEEDIYDYLMANPQEQPKPQSGQGQPKPGQPGQPGSGTPDNTPGDYPIHFGEKIQGAPDVDANGNTIKAPTAQELINNTLHAIHAAKIAGQPGSIPGNTEQIVEQFLKPIIPWESEFYRWFSDLLDEDFTMSRPNRRYLHQGLYMSSRFQDEGRLAHLMWFMDVSGSVTDKEVLRFSSEMKYVWDRFKPAKMTIVQFDTRITEVIEFEEDDDFKKIRIIGRGGTDLAPVKEYIEKHQPTAAIVFSDLYCTPMKKLKQDVPMLWVSTTSTKGAFGKTIYIKV